MNTKSMGGEFINPAGPTYKKNQVNNNLVLTYNKFLFINGVFQAFTSFKYWIF